MSFASKGFVISEIEKRIAASGGGGITLSGTVTAANSTTLDLTATGALAFGTGANDPRLSKDATNRMLLSRAGTTPADLRLAGLINSSISPSSAGGTFDLSDAAVGGGATIGRFNFTTGDWQIGGYKLAFGSSVTAAPDAALSRADAGIVLVEDGSGNPASIRNKVSCVTSLATAAAPTLITPQQSNTYFDNLGAAGQAFWTLPTTWSSGLQYNWTVISTQGIRVQCSPNQTIVAGTVVTTTTSGYIESLSYGSHIQLTAITSGTFYVTKLIGDWSVI